MKNLIFWTWCLPQTLLGWLLKGLYVFFGGISKEHGYGVAKLYIVRGMLTGVSLGRYIFLNRDHRDETGYLVKHEFGHTLQSFIFGPLYLVVIGIPSVTWSIAAIFSQTIKDKYFKLWPENWANKLGGNT